MAAAPATRGRHADIHLHLDRSGSPFGLYFERFGVRVDLEEALDHGFVVEPGDAAAVLTLLARFVAARDEHSK